MQLPVQSYEFIKNTYRYQLPALLNNLNAESEILKHVNTKITASTLLRFKKVMKDYFLDKY